MAAIAEVDKLIFSKINELGYVSNEDDNSDDESATTLDNISSDVVVKVTVGFVRSIDPDDTTEYPTRLPENTGARYKLCALLANRVKSFGFKGDVGYQTFLYANTSEIRRVLLFLIEKLPKQSASHSQHLTGAQLFSKVFCQAVQSNLDASWMPPFINVHRKGFDCIDSFANLKLSPQLFPQPLAKPNELDFSSIAPELKLRLLRVCEIVQTPIMNSHPRMVSITAEHLKQTATLLRVTKRPKPALPDKPKSVSEVTKNSDYANVEEEHVEVNSMQKIVKQEREAELGSKLDENDTLDNLIKRGLANLSDMQEVIDCDISEIKIRELAIKKQTLIATELLPLGEHSATEKIQNVIAQTQQNLDNFVEKSRQNINQLDNDIDNLYKQLTGRDSRLSELRAAIDLCQEQLGITQSQSETQKAFERRLEAELKSIDSRSGGRKHRQMMIKRIMDLVSSIKKQKQEINKILADIRLVQKELNGISGRLERAFKVAGIQLYKDVKGTSGPALIPSAKEAYHWFLNIEESCGNIVDIADETAVLRRQSTELEDQIDAELKKDFSGKLMRLEEDIERFKIDG